MRACMVYILCSWLLTWLWEELNESSNVVLILATVSLQVLLYHIVAFLTDHHMETAYSGRYTHLLLA